MAIFPSLFPTAIFRGDDTTTTALLACNNRFGAECYTQCQNRQAQAHSPRVSVRSVSWLADALSLHTRFLAIDEHSMSFVPSAVVTLCPLSPKPNTVFASATAVAVDGEQLYTISAFDAEGGDGNGTKAWAIFCGLISSVISGLLAFLQVSLYTCIYSAKRAVHGCLSSMLSCVLAWERQGVGGKAG